MHTPTPTDTFSPEATIPEVASAIHVHSPSASLSTSRTRSCSSYRTWTLSYAGLEGWLVVFSIVDGIEQAALDKPNADKARLRLTYPALSLSSTPCALHTSISNLRMFSWTTRGMPFLPISEPPQE